MVKTKAVPEQKKSLGLLAEFDRPASLVDAAREMNQRGFQGLEAYSPFPIHGIDAALGVKPSPLPWMVLGAGVSGGIVAMAFQWWTNAVDYPYLISGKPLFSLPANIPVTFEVIILAAALAAFFGMLAINGLPKLCNPLLRNDRFRAATNNGFFLFVPAEQEETDAENKARSSLDDLGCEHVEELLAIDESLPIPRSMIMASTILGALALIPPLLIANARSTTSDKPRLHTFFDMDFQPKFKSQTSTTIFADGRAMRPRIHGTIPRGQLKTDSRFYSGIEPSSDDASASPEWVQVAPLPVTDELLRRGRERFNIHCAVCHGRSGQGNGLASLRALELEQGTWVPPTSIHADHVIKQPDGQLYNTIKNGIRKMPAYGHQIDPEDRWAIVTYLRALQRSQKSSVDDVPEDLRSALRETN